MTTDADAAPPRPQTLYDAVGGEPTFRRIAARFYEEVARDEVLRPLYPEDDLAAAEERLRLFLMQFWGARRRTASYGVRRVWPRDTSPSRSTAPRAAPGCARCASRWTRRTSRTHRAEIWERFEIFAYNMTTHAG